MSRSCSRNEKKKKKKNAYRKFVGKAKGNGPPERPRRGWVDNIKIVLTERVLDLFGSG
jgi:hypothetical protein